MAAETQVGHDQPLPRDEVIVAAHQINYLPGTSVIDKVTAADVVIWMDAAQYTRGGFINRNRMPDGSWLTVPVDHSTLEGQIRDVRISEHTDWRPKHQRTLRQHYRGVVIDLICEAINKPQEFLIDLNMDCLFMLHDPKPWHFQSDLDYAGATVSERLASMVEQVGSETYLSGASGRGYLDLEPFDRRGIKVRFQRPRVHNPCALEPYRIRQAA